MPSRCGTSRRRCKPEAGKRSRPLISGFRRLMSSFCVRPPRPTRCLAGSLGAAGKAPSQPRSHVALMTDQRRNPLGSVDRDVELLDVVAVVALLERAAVVERGDQRACAGRLSATLHGHRARFARSQLAASAIYLGVDRAAVTDRGAGKAGPGTIWPVWSSALAKRMVSSTLALTSPPFLTVTL